MLKNLTIHNFAILDDINLSFAPGLNVFSGETGAGKSIIIEALGFVLGSRGGLSLLKEGAEKMSVSAVFESSALPKPVLQEYGIEKDSFTLMRELDSKGKSKGFVNNITVSASALANIGSYLVDFHGQHDHHTLLRTSEHLDLLDKYAKTHKDVAGVAELYGKMQTILSKIEALHLSQAEKDRLLDLYNFQYKEISEANVKPGEDIELEANLPKLKHSGKLKELAEKVYELLYESESAAVDLGSKAAKYLGEMSELDVSLNPVLEELESALRNFEDAAQTIYHYKENIAADPDTLDDMLGRQQKINKLKLKYGPEITDIIANGEKLEDQIASLSSSEEKEHDLQKELAEVKEILMRGAMVLHEKRLLAAKKMDAMIRAELMPLGFNEVKFETDVVFEEEALNAKGADSVEFLFSPNPGQSLKPLKSIASGGEMSRVMLGLKTVLAGKIPTMVFDEIDAGIGGHTGLKVGEKLRKVAFGRQVLCVTHLAQVAVYGAAHYNVTKKSDKNSTKVILARLEGEAKTAEIARMLGSTSGKNSAGFKHAQELIEFSNNNIN
ncbi:DNA repair protein RecN (Recombination protein N) [Elusimicrobium simillimum]|uniref:DNA repair protein RecN n=1 Tax=Elusimicrobium simillimum TaxID=3143438 RepID=UPI003C7055CB